MPVCVEKAEVCLFQGVTVLEPGQALVQYLEGELCYTVHCLHHRDPESGFYAMDVSSVNCSQKCGPVWSFFDAFEHFIYHQYGPAVLHAELLFMCSTRCTSRPLTLRCAVAPAKISPARLLMKTGLRIFSLYELHIHLLFAPLIIYYLFIYLFSQRDWFCFFVQAGSSWVENCTRYDCVETTVGAVILASGVVCPPFNDTECLQVWTSEKEC